MNKGLKISNILNLIFSSVSIILIIYSLITLASPNAFKNAFDLFIGTYKDMLNNLNVDISFLNDETIAQLSTLMYLFNLIQLILSFITSVLVFIFTLLNFKDYSLDKLTYKRKNKIHITLIVFLVINYLLITFNLSSDLSNDLISVMYSIISIVGLIGTILYIVNHVTFQKSIAMPIRPQSNNYQPVQNNFVNNNEENLTIKDDSVSIEQNNEPINNETENNNNIVDNSKLESAYEALANLEKLYSNNKISEDEYLQRKQDILNDLKNNK